MSKIITINTYPPIPDRRWDWCAYYDGDEERPWTHGWGSTREAALADLLRLDQDGKGKVEARVESAWRDIATAPRDPQQWFWALNAKSGKTYHVSWCPKRQCFVHTKTNNRIHPTHWRDDNFESPAGRL